ncbi:MAG: biopolymer transporter ExbD [Alcanivoracaceae bacterium]|jgi:biopolymer transport protein ExbD|nr:biopolymer transporter ExbD [Alcanivoracaceae bacterium]
MKKSSRAKRMERRHKKNQAVAALNLTSLMDIFTILVFFLLVNSSNSQQLPDNKDIELPESTAQELPSEVLTIQLSGRDIIVQDVKIASVTEVMATEEPTIPALVEELEFRASRSLPVLNEDGEPEREVMVLADREVPYSLIRRVMLSCTQTEYSKISFAVLRKAEEEQP